MPPTRYNALIDVLPLELFEGFYQAPRDRKEADDHGDENDVHRDSLVCQISILRLYRRGESKWRQGDRPKHKENIKNARCGMRAQRIPD